MGARVPARVLRGTVSNEGLGLHEHEAQLTQADRSSRLTDDIVYKRLAPSVRDELKKVTPRNEKGYLKNKLHQRLTGDIGNPKLREHLTGVLMLMKYSPDFSTFVSRLDKEYPRWDKTLSIPFPEQPKPLTALSNNDSANDVD